MAALAGKIRQKPIVENKILRKIKTVECKYRKCSAVNLKNNP
jgi:hypothetical protein